MMDDDQDTTAAMAAAMGFSSFGTQNPNKRRKFNPNADAFVAANPPSISISALSLQNTTTGSNSVPLGVRKRNTDEIDLDDDDDGNENEGQDDSAGGVSLKITTDDMNDKDVEPQYLDTSQPSDPIPAETTDDFQSKIDAIVSSSTEGQAFSHPSSSAPRGRHSFQGTWRGGYENRNTHAEAQGQTDFRDLYFDPDSIRNPWEKLEKSLGLESDVSWTS